MKEKIVLFITTDFPPKRGGISSWAYEEYTRLKSHNKVILLNESDKKQNKGVTYSNYKELVKKFKLIERNFKIERIIFFHWEPAKYLLLKLLIKKYLYIIVLHGWEFLRPRSWFTKFQKKLLLQAAEQVWVTSPYMKKQVEKYKVVKNVYIVPILISNKFKTYNKNKIAALKNVYNIKNKKIVISVARLVERKGIFTVIKALEPLVKKYKNLMLFLVGDGELKSKIRKYIKKNKLSDRVILFGEVSNKKLVDLYNISDLFVLTPKEIKEHGDVEGFGIVYHEAHKCGLPVIGSDTGGVKYALKLINNSYIIKPGAHKKLTKIIEKILYD